MIEEPEYTVWKGLIKQAIKEALEEDRKNMLLAKIEENRALRISLRELEEERRDHDGFSSGTKCCLFSGKR